MRSKEVQRVTESPARCERVPAWPWSIVIAIPHSSPYSDIRAAMAWPRRTHTSPGSKKGSVLQVSASWQRVQRRARGEVRRRGRWRGTWVDIPIAGVLFGSDPRLACRTQPSRCHRQARRARCVVKLASARRRPSPRALTGCVLEAKRVRIYELAACHAVATPAQVPDPP